VIPVELRALRRFFNSVKLGPPGEHPAGPCWLWTGSLSKGYARITVRGRILKAHRFAYAMLVDPGLRWDLVLDHTCRVRRCVFPGHLEPVTSRQNTLRGVASRRAENVLPLFGKDQVRVLLEQSLPGAAELDGKLRRLWGA
jgi:hypothetical protein